ncbi:MAG: hypothetical protein U0L21_07550, partial [Alistipes sp.]|nr:hypothetical protein [Alistipes sp.]
MRDERGKMREERGKMKDESGERIGVGRVLCRKKKKTGPKTSFRKNNRFRIYTYSLGQSCRNHRRYDHSTKTP